MIYKHRYGQGTEEPNESTDADGPHLRTAVHVQKGGTELSGAYCSRPPLCPRLWGLLCSCLCSLIAPTPQEESLSASWKYVKTKHSVSSSFTLGVPRAFSPPLLLPGSHTSCLLMARFSDFWLPGLQILLSQACSICLVLPPLGFPSPVAEPWNPGLKLLRITEAIGSFPGSFWPFLFSCNPTLVVLYWF
jgi:hypothetical protein